MGEGANFNRHTPSRNGGQQTCKKEGFRFKGSGRSRNDRSKIKIAKCSGFIIETSQGLGIVGLGVFRVQGFGSETSGRWHDTLNPKP